RSSKRNSTNPHLRFAPPPSIAGAAKRLPIPLLLNPPIRRTHIFEDNVFGKAMDYDYSQHEREFEQGNVLAFNVEEEDDYYEDYEDNQQPQQQEQRGEQFQQPQQTQTQQQQQGRRDKRHEEEIGAADNGGKANNHSSSAPGKLFVGGLSWDTTEETFSNYFSKFGEITDAVIMLDRHSGRPRGFGFVTFSDSVVADRVLKQEHIIDDRTVEVKKTVPREDMDFKGIRVKKIFVGGLPPSLTEDDLKDYFIFYGSVTEYQIMYDHTTGRSRGFGFVTFDSEDSVDRLFADRRTHELGGKEVEIKKAEPRRFGGGGGDYGGATKPYGGGFNDTNGYGPVRGSGGRYSGKMGRGGGGGYGAGGGYGSYPGFNGYGAYGAAGYAGSAAGLYGAYGGYGYGFGFNNLMMYGNGMYGAAGAGAAFPGGGYGAGAAAGYGASKGYERGSEGSGGNGGRGYGNGGGAGVGGKSYGGSSSGSSGGGNVAGRHHPYRK
ncbi:Heterogeneous nuclear ribonucleoprotein 1, partial [Linum grandiflorum]